MADGPVLLSTRPLPEALIQAVLERGIRIETCSFIETVPIQTIETISEIEAALRMTATVIFTSQQAVEAVAAVSDGIFPDWQLYCTGPATANAVKEHFGEENIDGTARDANSLATLIIERSDSDEFIFFCGDARRPELPERLQEAGRQVWEIVVYETIPVYQQLHRTYAGILFYSPSAVESFFRKNTLPEHCIAFAIGETTATAIRKFSSNMIVLADSPNKEDLVQKALEIFTT